MLARETRKIMRYSSKDQDHEDGKQKKFLIQQYRVAMKNYSREESQDCPKKGACYPPV